jgi:hypothetical protein
MSCGSAQQATSIGQCPTPAPVSIVNKATTWQQHSNTETVRLFFVLDADADAASNATADATTDARANSGALARSHTNPDRMQHDLFALL